MAQPVNIAVFPSEGENAFELYRSLRYAPRFRVFGASSRPGHARFLFEDNQDDLPSLENAAFLPAFNRYLEQKHIDLVFPTHDSVAVYLAEHQAELEAALVGSNAETARLCRKKKLFYEAIGNTDFCPEIYPDASTIRAFPVFLKPDQGQGAQGCQLARTPDDIARAFARRKDLIISEYLPGEECTVDCFSDRHGELRFAGPRRRDVVKMGISFQSSSMAPDPEINRIAAWLNQRFHPRGLWFFQIKKAGSGRWKVLEISVRAAGSMGLYRQTGVNFAQLAAYDALGLDVEILHNDVSVRLSRCLQSRYALSLEYSHVYMDLDDTLLVRGRVNLTAMAFLYQCLNTGKTVTLLSRHEGDIVLYLREHCIDPGLFCHIIGLSAEESKSQYITRDHAIFIDNLFGERREVKEKKGIAVFDVDALESLVRDESGIVE